jgi:hypothetical protein
VKPIEGLEARLDDLEARVVHLEEALLLRRAAAPGAAAMDVQPVPEESPPDGDLDFENLVPKAASVLAALTALGTSFLVLGGAFFVRTITDAGSVPHAAGVALGFAYALGTIAAADRLAGGGRRLLGAFLLLTAIGIGDPLLFEAMTRFHAIGPGIAAAGLAVLTVAVLVVARRRALPGIAWTAAVAAAATAAALSLAGSSLVPFAAAFLAIEAVVDGIPGPAAWRSVRWPAAVMADGMVLWAAAAHSVPRADSSLLLLALALPVLTLSGVVVRTVAANREADDVDVLQSFASTALGLGVAVQILGAAGRGRLGAGALVVAALCYAAALGPLVRTGRPRRNAGLAATLALGLALFGSALLLSGPVLAGLWLVLAAAAAVSSLRVPALRLHAAAFVWAAAWPSGLLESTLAALVSAAGATTSVYGPAAIATIVVAAASLAFMARLTLEPDDVSGRIARLGLAVVAGLGAAGLAVAVATSLASAGTGGIAPAARALLRTASLASGAVIFAALARRASWSELAGFAYALLVLGGVKLLVEDFPAGRPLTLFVAFALYGAALISIPKLLRVSRSTPAGP